MCVFCGQMRGHLQQLAERRDRAGRNHFELPLNAFCLPAVNGRVCQAQRLYNSAEKFGTETSGLDQRHGTGDQDSNHNSGKTGTGADVQPRCAGTSLKSHQLSRIEDVPVP